MSMLMLKGVFKFIGANWQAIALGLLVLFIISYWANRTDTISDQKAKIAKLEKDQITLTEQCKAEKQKLVDQITSQNKAIAEFNAKNSSNQQKLSQARQEVIQIQQKYNEDIRKVLAGTKPQDCSAAIKYLVDAVKEFTPAETERKLK